MSSHARQSTSAMTLAALGVVFGDIGTSPLYALKESFHASHGMAITQANVLGILSLIFWSLLLMVSIKYVAFIMRANNNGEGGIMALLALGLRNKSISPTKRLLIISIGLFGAALFFGDAMITPAISVLSAVEGLTVVAEGLHRFVMPITIGILIALFLVQRKGTGSMGTFFGPLTLLWFISLGVFGLMSIVQNPSILLFINPVWALQFILEHTTATLFILGAVVLTITGGEALYADMGHFGKKPISIGWFLIVLPCLLLNYAGQGALILRDAASIENPFYNLVPPLLLIPMIILATIATVIASQAVISGVFSIGRQAIQLGYIPRLSVIYTSKSESGQIYIPFLNWLVLIGVLLLVLLFQTSSKLAAAYGIAVTLTMLCDTLLVAFVMFSLWRWSLAKVLLFAVPFLCLDIAFLGATSLKILQGGWVPLSIGAITFTVMITWKHGREILAETLKKESLPLDVFIKSVGDSAHLVQGTAVFMAGSQSIVPHALLHNLKHNKVLHELNVIMTIITQDIPYVAESERFEVTKMSDQFWTMRAYYGFQEQPNAPKVLKEALESVHIKVDSMSTSYFVSRERIIHTVGKGMAPWREKLFISMSRNTSSASDFFQIPTNRVLEVGSQVEI